MIGKIITGIRIASAFNRQSSDRLIQIAQRAIKNPKYISDADVKSLAASVLSQAKPGV